MDYYILIEKHRLGNSLRFLLPKEKVGHPLILVMLLGKFAKIGLESDLD